jgi:hypothetical protein
VTEQVALNAAEEGIEARVLHDPTVHVAKQDVARQRALRRRLQRELRREAIGDNRVE